MAFVRYCIPSFLGVNQSVCENDLPANESPDAENMDTDGGRLSVARGYVRHGPPAHPAGEDCRRLYIKNSSGALDFIVTARTGLTLFRHGGTGWETLAGYATDCEDPAAFDFQRVKIGATEYLLASNGAQQLRKWDGQAASAALFGSAEALSDMPLRFMELYYNRLFAAGDPAHPARLYWSMAPGGTRSMEDFSNDPASENTSGGHVEVGADSDPITGLFALSNQLVIWKRNSLYGLLGDRPANYRLYPVNAEMERLPHTACVRCGDVLYVLSGGGLSCYDGQTVRRLSDASKARGILARAALSRCTGAACRDRLYFAVALDGAEQNNALLVYDLARRCYMLRTGFTVTDLCAADGTLYLLTGEGLLCRFNEGESYDGAPIRAYWRTPETDMGSKVAQKQLKELYLRGSGGILAVEATAGADRVFYERIMPKNSRGVLEAPLSGDGRAFSFTLSNEGGSCFTIEGGVELLCDAQRRIL